MKIIKFYLLMILGLANYISCITSPYQGLLATNTSYHIYSSQNGSTLTSAKIEKMVESCSDGNPLLFLFNYGKGESIPDLMKSAGMTKIALVDRRSVSIFTFFFYQECVQIYGE
jgi:hypothetical protein